jgi:DNA-binding PadR family transcriptional regulator
MPNMTVQTRAVLAAFIRPDGSEVDLYGLQVVEKTGLAPGTAYPILNRLAEAGWLTSTREPHRGQPGYRARRQGGPPRRYYALTSDGWAALQVAQKRRSRA